MPPLPRSSRPDHPGPSPPLHSAEHSQQYSPPPSAQYSTQYPSSSSPSSPPTHPQQHRPPPLTAHSQRQHRPPPLAAHSKQPPPPAPRIRFDPWNSSASGHQQDNHNRLAGSTAWRASRTAKLARQFEGGGIMDSGGVGGEEKEGGNWSGKENRRGDLVDSVVGGKSERAAAAAAAATNATTTAPENQPTSPAPVRKKKIFQGLQIYINGSTAPLVSDHRLKQLLVQHGAGVCISLARRTVTHVILGTPNGSGGGRGGAGGGLSARKMEKEIKRVRGCGVKYVGVEWILQSIQAGHRLSEARFSLHPAFLHQLREEESKSLSKNERLKQRVSQKSVYEIFYERKRKAEEIEN